MQRVFRMRTAVSRLKSDVAKLGGAQDTANLRKGVAGAISKIQDDAQDIKAQLLRVPPQHKTRQTTKILSDFEVGRKPESCPSAPSDLSQSASIISVAISTILALSLSLPSS